MGEKIGLKKLLGDILFDIVGCFSLSVAIVCFSAPANIAPGGVSGISILINYLTGLPISIMSFAINIPLLVLAWLLLGRRFTLRTLKTVVIMTALLEVCAYLPVYRGNPILAALCAGVLEGGGLALVFIRGSTTGGTDVASRIIQLKFPFMSVGKLMLAVDGFVLLASAIVYRSIENALYGMIVIYTSTHVIDAILYGQDMGKVMLVISQKEREIAAEINGQLARGCTIIPAKGSYTGDQRPMLMCAVRKNEIVNLKKVVFSVDPSAFFIALEANEVIGEGFKDIQEAR